MRFYIVLILLGAVAQFSMGDDPPADEPAQTRESAARVTALAERYEFFADAERKTRFDLNSKSLLTYSNPIRGDVYGNVFVWTRFGRPEVIGAIFDFRSEDKFDTELHILSRRNVVGVRDGKAFWNPAAAGVEFRAVPNAPAPAETPAARLRQMRDISRGFTVEREHPEQGKGEMRLLPQPIYRYPSDDAHESPTIDGSVFVFVEGTDPETFLILEATQADEKPVWNFALARMNIVAFRGLYKGDEVWQVKPVEWDAVFDRHEPYAIIREKPQRGLVRTR